MYQCAHKTGRMSQKHCSSPQQLPITHIAEGEAVRIVAIAKGERGLNRLADLGIVPSVVLQVTKKTRCSLVVKVENTQIALRHGQAQHIFVEPVSPALQEEN